MRSNAFDAGHGVAALSFVTATLAGWTIQDWAAFAALLYSLMLIAQKAYQWWLQWRSRPDDSDSAGA
jgi:hypothetical protein